MARNRATPGPGSSPPRSSCSPSADTPAPRSARSRRPPGWRPARAALYKHFASKEELLEAALSERIAEIDAFNARLELEPLGDLRAELTLVARWGLAELARERELIRIVMRDGGRVPELAERFHATVVRRGTELATRTLERYAAERGVRVARPRGARRGRLRLAGRLQPPADHVRRATSPASTPSASPRPGSTPASRSSRPSKGAKSMPDPCSTPTRHRTAIRAALAGVGLIQVVDGLYALLAPRLVLRGLPARARLGRGAARLQRAPGPRRRRPLPRHRRGAARRRLDACSGGW